VAIFAPQSCYGLANGALALSQRKATAVEVKKFRNGESYLRLPETVRGKTVVFVQDFHKGNLNDTLVETMLMVDAARRASAKKIVLVCDTLPYVDEAKGSIHYDVDYFKLVLNLLFKAVDLDELRLGGQVINKRTSPWLVQDEVFSRFIAPPILAFSRDLVAPAVTKPKEFVFFAGNGYRVVADKIIANILEAQKIRATVIDFEDNWENDLHGKTAYIFQTCNTGRINDDLIETLLMIYTAKKRGAKEIVVIMPYQPYNRQERKAQTREPISAKVVANALVKAAGATQVVTFDLHAAATQGFFDVPMQHITAMYLLADFFKRGEFFALSEQAASGAPDVGRGRTARRFGKLMFGENYKFVIVDKDRPKHGVSQVAGVIGTVKEHDVVIIDDMIDSGGSIIGAIKALKARGANQVYVATVHGVFSDVELALNTPEGRDEYEKICDFLRQHNKSPFDYIELKENSFVVNALVRLQAFEDLAGLVFTDTLMIDQKMIVDTKKVKVVSIVDLLTNVCSRIINGESLQDYQQEAF